MEAHQELKILSRFFALTVTIFIAASGCSSAKKYPSSNVPTAEQNPSGSPMGPPEPFGPPKPQTYGPEPIQLRPVILVFGPGLTKAFCEVGVLRVLNENKIPIGAIYGSEMGSLIGALYASDMNLNHFEWGLLKFKEDTFDTDHGLFSKGPSDGVNLYKKLDRVFHDRDVSSTQVPLKVILAADGQPVSIDRGPLNNILRGALANPKLFKAYEWNHQTLSAVEEIEAFEIDQARALGTGPVVVIDPNGKAGNLAADVLIQPDLSGIDEMDFKKETDSAFRGKVAAEAKLAEIRHWVGVPQP